MNLISSMILTVAASSITEDSVAGSVAKGDPTPWIFMGLIAAVIIFSIFQIFYVSRQNREKTKRRIRREWGALPKREYTDAELESISHYYKKNQSLLPIRGQFYIDDITWNDLDMDKIYIMLNSTQSSAGDEYLYEALRKPCMDQSELDQREHLADFFANQKEIREKMQYALAKIGRTKHMSISDYIEVFMELHLESNIVHIIPLVFLLIAIALIFVMPSAGILSVIMIILYNVVTYFKRKGEIEPYFICVSYIVRLVKNSEELVKQFAKVPELSVQMEELKRHADKLHGIIAGSSFIGAGGGISDNPSEMLLDYLRFLTHIDIIQFNNVQSKVVGSLTDVMAMTEIIGRLELSIAIASFRELIPYYCKPEFASETADESKDTIGGLHEQNRMDVKSDAAPSSCKLSVENIYHPLIKEPVANSITEARPVLLTGSNASGKSTFLKTVAINTILAQSMNTSLSTTYQANFFRVYSSMALRDDLEGEESYYMVEIRSLKRIVEAAKDRAAAPIICFVDEVLRGTNTVERIAASAQILKTLAQYDVMAFAATHDVELTHMLTDYYSNYHFREDLKDDDVEFNYILYPGRSQTRNAIRLLGIMGYDEKITEAAESCAQEFLKSGNWKLI